MIRAVLFDLDGTLYDRDDLVLRLAKDQFMVFPEQLQDIDERRFVQRLVELDARGYGSKPELYERVVVEWSLDAELANRLDVTFGDSYVRHCELSDDTSTTLQTFREHGRSWVSLRMGLRSVNNRNWKI